MNRMTKCAEWQSLFIEFHASAKLSSCHAVDRRSTPKGGGGKKYVFSVILSKKSASFGGFGVRIIPILSFCQKNCAKWYVGKKEKRWLKWISVVLKLSYQDSNLDRQNQKLQCYHYTIRQSSLPKTSVLKRCKGTHNIFVVQIFLQLFWNIFYLAISKK